MAYVEAENIITPLGKTAQENLDNIRKGKTALREHADPDGMLETYTASMFDKSNKAENGTKTEELAIKSIKNALKQTEIDIESERTLMILSTTKGDIENLMNEEKNKEQFYISETADRIAEKLGLKTKPITVCNACISGLAAIITANRLIDADMYDTVIVTGIETQGKFIISGFQSLKAMSPKECRPFDMERIGMNLGEAVGTIVLGKKKAKWRIEKGEIANDAYHISAPAKKGDGLLKCLKAVTEGIDRNDIAQINLHGTATMFNDQMESVAVERAGLSDIMATCLKGYYGHTMGAAGVIETIIAMKETEEGIVAATRGFEEAGVSGKTNISNEERKTDKRTIIKTLSGFGGVNAAIRATMNSENDRKDEEKNITLRTTHTIDITPKEINIDGQRIRTEKEGEEMLTEIYKNSIHDYPKYYKMDKLSRLGFIATELLTKRETKKATEERSVIMFNRTSSINTDLEYIKTIESKNGYYPSPSVFVYTLPNIVTGEIAIRNGYRGETSFYIMNRRDRETERKIISATMRDKDKQSAITGWIDYETDEKFEAKLEIIVKENK